MKVYVRIHLLVLVYISLYKNVNCAYKLQNVFDDFVSVVKKSYGILKDNLNEFGVKIKNLVGKSSPTTPSPNELNDDASKAFNEFITNKWDRAAENPEFVNLRSESRIHVQLMTPQLARWHGRNMVSHVVQTRDGYFLTLHRLPAKRFLRNRTVLLHHGLLGSSSDWILLGSQKSLPYILADAGYDVWIANARGNYCSRGHVSMTVDYPDYWNFSWQDMGLNDLPAIIDYIRMAKNMTKPIDFIGHSMGATALLVLLSSIPHYNQYLRVGVLLAPLAYMSNIEGPLNTLSSVSEEIITTMGEGEFLASRKVPKWLAKKYCVGPFAFCSNPLLFLSGIPQTDKWDPSFIARFQYHVPAGGSIDTILHYIQLAKTGKFHKFNDEFSEFNVSNISLPIAFFSSSDDWLATVPNVLKLFFLIQNPIDHYIIRGRNMTHTDFVWGSEATAIVFNKVLEYLETGLTWSFIKTNEINALN